MNSAGLNWVVARKRGGRQRPGSDLGRNGAVRSRKLLSLRAGARLVTQTHQCPGKPRANNLVDAVPDKLPADPQRVKRIPEIEIALRETGYPRQAASSSEAGTSALKGEFQFRSRSRVAERLHQMDALQWLRSTHC